MNCYSMGRKKGELLLYRDVYKEDEKGRVCCGIMQKTYAYNEEAAKIHMWVRNQNHHSYKHCGEEQGTFVGSRREATRAGGQGWKERESPKVGSEHVRETSKLHYLRKRLRYDSFS